MEEFFSRLETIGKAWHKAYDTIDSDTDRVIKRTKMDARTTLDLLEHLSPTVLLKRKRISARHQYGS